MAPGGGEELNACQYSFPLLSLPFIDRLKVKVIKKTELCYIL